MAAADSIDDVDTAGWDAGFGALFARVASRFASPACRRQARAYLDGLLCGVERKNSWQLAEHAGDATPDKSQRLLNSYAWDDGAVRADLRGYVADEFGEPGAVLAVDETGFVKKGT